MNVMLPTTETSNAIFSGFSPDEFNKKQINLETDQFLKKLIGSLQNEDVAACKKMATDYVQKLKAYLNETLETHNVPDPLVEKYCERFLNQLDQFLPRINHEVGALGEPDGSVVSKTRKDIVDRIESLLKKDIHFVRTKEPRTDFAGYDRCKVFTKKKLLNRYSKLGNLNQLLKLIPEYKKYIFDRGFDLHSFTLHYSTSKDVVHYQFGLWRDKQNHKKLSSKYLQSHYDPDPENIKSIFYLSDVQDLSHGPFKYFKRSSGISPQNILERTAGATMCGINLLETDANRLFFAALPDQLMHHNIFGSLLDQHQLDNIEMDKKLLPVFGNMGTFILFDPLGIHSGGLCTGQATRLNLQMIFKKK